MKVKDIDKTILMHEVTLLVGECRYIGIITDISADEACVYVRLYDGAPDINGLYWFEDWIGYDNSPIPLSHIRLV